MTTIELTCRGCGIKFIIHSRKIREYCTEECKRKHKPESLLGKLLRDRLG